MYSGNGRDRNQEDRNRASTLLLPSPNANDDWDSVSSKARRRTLSPCVQQDYLSHHCCHQRNSLFLKLCDIQGLEMDSDPGGHLLRILAIHISPCFYFEIMKKYVLLNVLLTSTLYPLLCSYLIQRRPSS